MIQRGRTIRLPDYTIERLSFIHKMALALTSESGREPTTAEIAASTGLSLNTVRELVAASVVPQSLDQPITAEGLTLGDLIEDTGMTALEDAVYAMERRQIVSRALDDLPSRERRVLEMRFGLVDGVERSLSEIGRELGLTRERVRQIEATAKKKLRTNDQLRSL